MSLYIYPHSRDYAEKFGELEQWQKSHRLNIGCKSAVEKAIAKQAEAPTFPGGASKAVRENYGYDRLNWILANTIQLSINSLDFSEDNKLWAKDFYIDRIKTQDFNAKYRIDAPAAALNEFTNQARQEYRALNLLDHTHCLTDKEQDYTGKVVVIRPDMFRDEYKSPDFQLFVPSHGNGCRPNAVGRSVFGHFLIDGDRAAYWRQDIIGVLKHEFLPEWAVKALAEQEKSQIESEDMEIKME